jgi:hypothetical protein
MSVRGLPVPSAVYHKSEAGLVREKVKNFSLHQRRLADIETNKRHKNVFKSIDDHEKSQVWQRIKKKNEYRT